MERTILATGIGGQGIQLATQVLARAAMGEGREVMLFGSYGGMMRGGNTDTALVLADGPVSAPPVPPAGWAGVVMHHDYMAPTVAKLPPGALAFVNTSVVTDLDAFAGRQVVGVAATDVAVDTGGILTASMVMTGALAAATGLVAVESLEQAVADALPPYRRQHVERNVAALRAGAALFAGSPLAPAWPGERTGAVARVG